MKYLFAILLLAGCSDTKQFPFIDICYMNKDSGQRLLCLTNDGSYKVFFDKATEFGSWIIKGQSITFTRKVYYTFDECFPGNACDPDHPKLSEEFSCTYANYSLPDSRGLILKCKGSTHSKYSVTTTLTEDDKTLNFNQW